MTDAQGAGEIRRLLDRFGVRPRKRLGQHFLVDPNMTRKIVAFAGVGAGDKVVEVGAGTGTLTRALAGTGAEVVALETDVRLRPLLAETVGGLENVDLVFGDALGFDWARLFQSPDWVMVANLPYNVGTPLVLSLLRGYDEPRRLVVMMQSEVVDRLAAPPGSRTYGLPSVVAQLHAVVSKGFRVPPGVFYPRPMVDSAVVALDRHATLDPATGRAIALAEKAFRQRRKMLRSSLKGEAAGLIEEAGFDPSVRPEDLAPADFLTLARAA
jgi:16S rRNA (adenine1518-N6/adenine1519-N6)-dimethyltransferase